MVTIILIASGAMLLWMQIDAAGERHLLPGPHRAPTMPEAAVAARDPAEAVKLAA